MLKDSDFQEEFNGASSALWGPADGVLVNIIKAHQSAGMTNLDKMLWTYGAFLHDRTLSTGMITDGLTAITEVVLSLLIHTPIQNQSRESLLIFKDYYEQALINERFNTNERVFFIDNILQQIESNLWQKPETISSNIPKINA